MTKEKKPKKIKRYNYPLQYDHHMIDVPFLRKLPTLDENYPYRNLSFLGRLGRFFTYFICFIIAFPLIALLTGCKILKRKILKQNKELLKNGAITICNHVHMWDMVCVLKTIRPHTIYQPAWPTNLRGPNGALIRGSGGMPVPSGRKGLKRFSETMDEIMEEGGWMHFFPEGSMWFYYEAIRPFKKGAFALAVKFNKPIVPICINYRKAKGIRKIFLGGSPYFLTVNVGEPLMPDNTLEKNRAIEDLLQRSRKAMQDLGGFAKIIPQEDIQREQEDIQRELDIA